jgi:hypothetical protein
MGMKVPKRRPSEYYLSYLLTSLILVLSVAKSDAQQLSNQSVLIATLFADVNFQEILLELPSPVALRLQDATEESLLQFQQALSDRDITLTTIFSQNSVLELSFNVVNTLQRNDKQTYRRDLQGHVGVRVLDSAGNITVVKLIPLAYSDTVPRDTHKTLESAWKPSQFTSSEVNRMQRIVRRYLEPVVISAAIGTTVYLLYNVRSR